MIGRKKNIVCFCKEVDDVEIIKAMQYENVQSMQDLILATGASTGCGRCRAEVEKLYQEHKIETKDKIQLKLF